MQKDPYALKRRKGGTPAPALRRAPATTTDKAEGVRGYIPVQPETFHLLKRGTHVRYTKEEPDDRGAGHVFSGFVAKASHAVKFGGKPPTRTCLLLQNNFNPRLKSHARWMIPHDDVGRLYARGDAVALALYTGLLRSVKAIVTNLKRVADSHRALEARVRALERRGKR